MEKRLDLRVKGEPAPKRSIAKRGTQSEWVVVYLAVRAWMSARRPWWCCFPGRPQ